MTLLEEKTENRQEKADRTNPESTFIQLLANVENLGAKIWEEGGTLRYSAPKGIMTPDVLAEMSANKEGLLEFLRNRTEGSSGLPRIIPDPDRLHEPFALTDLQSAYLVGRDSSFELGNISCHAYVEMEKDGVDVPRLEMAWRKLIQRHDMLRAVMLPGGMQRVLKEVPPYEIKVEDLRPLSSEKAGERLENTRNTMSHQVLDAGTWPLFELRVTHVSDQISRLHFSLDQLILDGFSIQLLFRDLNDFYDRPDAGPEPLAVSFRDYVLAEARIPDTQEYLRSKQYWEKRIPDLPPAPELPLAKSPDTVESPEFSHRRLCLDAAKWNSLKDKAVARGLTPSGTVLAAYADILSSWSKKQKFTLNMTLFNRLPLHEGVMDIIGEFTSVNLLEVDNSERNTFTQRAGRIQSRFWDDLDHRYYSGIQVIREIGRNMSGSGSAAMPVVFTSTLGVSGAEDEDSFDPSRFGRVVYCITQTPQVWLDNQTFEENGALVCNWDAVEEIFPDGMLDDMFEAYETLLNALATDDGVWATVRRDYLPAGQSAARKKANDTGVPLSRDLLHTLFAERAVLAPDRTAVISSAVTLTYGELSAIAGRISGILREKNVKPNILVAVVMEKGWEQVAGVLGVLYAGAAYLPLDAAEPAQRLAALLEDGDVDIVLTQSWLEDTVSWPENIRRVHVDTLPKGVGKDLPEMPVRTPGDLAYVIYTSGSTGKAKGVMIDHQGAVNTILDVNRRFGVGPDDKVFGLSGLNFDLSVYDIFGTFAAGATLVLPDADKTREPAHWSSLVARHGISIWNSVPAFLQMLAEYAQNGRKDDFSSLRLTLLSGDWIPLDLPAQIQALAENVEIVSLGGATEVSIWSVFHPVKDVLPGWKSIPYGRPLGNQRLYALSPFMEDCPDHVPGDLYIGGDGMALGYWKDEEKTAASFIIHPETGERLYRAGDMVRYFPGGTMEFLGREDFQIKLNGYRVELGEIESVLKEHPGIRDAVVTLTPDTHGTPHLTAHLVQEPDSGNGLLEEKKAGNTEDDQYIDWRYLLLAARDQARGLPEGVTDTGNFLAFWEGLDNLCIAYMCRTLRELGIFSGKPRTLSPDEIAAYCNILPTHRKLMVRWLNVLAHEGLLECGSQGVYTNIRPLPEMDIDALWRETRSIQKGIGDMGMLVEYMERSCENLAALFRGDLDPHHLLFPEGSWEVAENVYQYNPMSQYSYGVLSAGIKSIVRDRSAGRPLRILEVGAGVGSSTAAVLPDLDPDHTLYTYTDISLFFLSEAKEKFQDYPFIEYSLFDINKSPLAQGYLPHSYDIIIANNVLHNAADMVRTVTWLQGLLDRNGCVFVLDQTKDSLPLLTTMAFLIDFSESEDERMAAGSPFLSKEQWGKTLEKSGLSKCSAFPVSGHPCDVLGQHVFVAQSAAPVHRLRQDRIKEILLPRLPAYMVPAQYTLLDKFPLTSTGKVDRKLLSASGGSLSPDRNKTFVAPRTPYEETLASIWAEILEVREVGIHDNFFELGGDSLLLTKLLNKMQAHFDNENVDWEKLTLRTLFEAPTVSGMAASIARQSGAVGSRDETIHSESQLVAMKTDGHRTPFFLISDGRGRLFVYNRLREHFDEERPLYGLQVHDIDSYVASGARIETIAAEYIRAIRTVQPEGPYLMGGFCMGGIIAREMARQLKEEGEKVDKVVLISSRKPPFLMDDDIFIFYMLCRQMGIPLEKGGLEVNDEDFIQVLHTLWHWAVETGQSGNWTDQLNTKEHGRFLECYRKLENMLSKERLAMAFELAVNEGHPHLSRMSLDEFIRMFSIYRTSVAAVAGYHPKAYSGSVLIMKPREYDIIVSEEMDSVTLWEDVDTELMDVSEISGSHLTCLEEPHVRQLALELNGALRRTER
ncbi:MAG: amino acid adenylation domain-containing protein [Desulfobacteraceae bacterium]|nr:amino acid adenylation domain-containing protein [Desulfobacteraceae bacterium]